MSNLIVAGLFGVGLTVLVIFLYSRLVFWRTSHDQLSKNYIEMTNRAISAERLYSEKSVELQYLKNTINTIASREVVAVLTDEQIGGILEALQQLTIAGLQNPALKN